MTWIFTGELYTPRKYILEQMAFEVHSARANNMSGSYFVISSYFIEHFLSNRIESDCVILMGCNGLSNSDMGEAWIKAGSNSFVSWSGDISLQETDYYTLRLVENYFRNGFEDGLAKVLPSTDYRSGDSWLSIYLKNVI